MIDIVYRTVRPLRLEKLQIIQNIYNLSVSYDYGIT